MERQTALALSVVDSSIWDSDLLLFRDQSGLFSAGIRFAGRGRYSHAAKAVRVDSVLACAEVREWYGGRIVTLESQVRAFPGHIDVFRTNPANRFPLYDRAAATRYMLELAGCRYGWLHIGLVGALHLPGPHLLASYFGGRPDDDLAQSKWPPYCSEAAAGSDRIGGGVDPVPHLADRLTEPSDLARSQFYEYMFTLIP